VLHFFYKGQLNIENVQITAGETIGIEGCGPFHEKAASLDVGSE